GLSTSKLDVIYVISVGREGIQYKADFGGRNELYSYHRRDVPDSHAALTVLVEEMRDVFAVGRDLHRGSVDDNSQLRHLDCLERRWLLRGKLVNDEGESNGHD